MGFAKFQKKKTLDKASVHTVFLLAPGCCAPLVLWVTCIREVFKKNFTPVLYFVHLLRLLLVVDPPTGIFETWPISIRVNTSLSESSGSMKHRRTMAFCEFSGDQCLLFIREGTPGRQPHYGISEAGLRFTCVFYTSFCKCNSRFRQVQCHSNNEKKYCYRVRERPLPCTLNVHFQG